MAFYESFKDAISLAREYKNSDLYEKILELQAQTNELEEESIQKSKIIVKKNEEIKKLKFKENLVYDKKYNCYYSTNEDNEIIGQPYCARCWEKEDVAIHLMNSVNDYKICPECDTNYDFKKKDLY